MPAYEKIVVITQKTALEELLERYNTREQARFYVEHMGVSFEGYEQAHEAYTDALRQLRAAMPQGVRSQYVERGFLPNFLFGDKDLVVAIGRDGLVVNTAKYLQGQPLLGVNPDPKRIDGVLLPFPIHFMPSILPWAMAGGSPTRQVTMGKAELNDGQSLLFVNDLFIGQRTHLSALYRLAFNGREEDQSSSGIIVSTGAGSTGWFRSILTGAAGIVEEFVKEDNVRGVKKLFRFDWEAKELCFCVREPFVSRTSKAGIVFGRLKEKQKLVITSRMPQNGVIFSDGIESDCLQFTSGTIAKIGIADRTLNLIVRETKPTQHADR
jgi:NAD kinase